MGKRHLSFLIIILGVLPQIKAQQNEVFKAELTKAWQFHSQKSYDSAMIHYISAFNNYTAPQLDNRILPEYKKVAKQLSAIFKKDQAIRVKFLKKNHPKGSKKRAALIQEMNEIDAENLVDIEAILAEYDWLGPHEVGYFGNKAFFFTLQHADLDKQVQYFDRTVSAVANGYVEPYQLAYLIDRISLREKRLLAFGSECRQDQKTEKYYVAPTFGIATLDERRSLVGLEPMAEYVTKYGMSWNAEAYKDQLPTLMEQLGF